jgi:hypothetical protein
MLLLFVSFVFAISLFSMNQKRIKYLKQELIVVCGMEKAFWKKCLRLNNSILNKRGSFAKKDSFGLSNKHYEAELEGLRRKLREVHKNFVNWVYIKYDLICELDINSFKIDKKLTW